jgi:hypothetical protein
VLPWFRSLNEGQLDALVASSRSFIPPHAHRFESRTTEGVKWVRARYGHTFDTNFGDVERDLEQDEVPTLMELLIKTIIADMPKYLPHLSDISDGSLITLLFNTYKRKPGVVMSNKVIKQFLVPQVSALDFKGILVEDSIIRLLPKSCPNLYSLSMGGCFTCMTDTNLQYLLKRCPDLRQLDISGCKYITELGMQHITKFGTQITLLSIRWQKVVNPKWVRAIASALPNLELLNITGCPCVHPDDLEGLRSEFSNLYIQYDTVDDIPQPGDDLDDLAQEDDVRDLHEADEAQVAPAALGEWGN